MAAPNELLAKSLTILAELQKAGKHVIRSAELPCMDRQTVRWGRVVKATGFVADN